MKRTIATLGVLGLGLMGATVAANAAPPDNAGPPEMVSICHATSSEKNPFVPETINVNGLRGRVGPGDIVPANSGDFLPNGQNNVTAENKAMLVNNCVRTAVVPPVVVPPAVVPPAVVPPAVVPPAVVPPAVVPPAVVPPAVVPPAAAPPAVVPKAAAKPAPAAAAPKAAPVPAANNLGYNVQTAVGDMPGTGIPAWLAGLTGLFTAVGALVLAKGGLRSRNANG